MSETNSADLQIHEEHKRSLVKALSFRVIVMIADFAIIFGITHQYELAIGVLILSNVSSTILYILHERFWNGIAWGRGYRS